MLYQQPEKLRHPLIFYYGHTAVFFVNKLRVARVITDRVDEAVESSCAIGVDEMSWDDLNPAHYKWPTPAQLRAYRARVRALVDGVIATAPLSLPITWESPLWIVLMGIEHERIHLETSSVLIRQLDIKYLRPHALWRHCPFATVPTSAAAASTGEVSDSALVPVPTVAETAAYDAYNARAGAAGSLTTRVVTLPASATLSPARAAASAAAAETDTPANALVSLPGGAVALGKAFDHPAYGWDNEYGRAESTVAPFAASQFLVSNGEYLKFVQAGGYSTREWWCQEGWGFVTYKKAAHPVFWIPVYANGESTAPATADDASAAAAAPAPVTYKYRLMCEEAEMPWAWPVDVTCLEAAAFCRWRHAQSGAAARGVEVRLPTEAEWLHMRAHAAAAGQLTAHTDDQLYWDRAPGNINFEYWASSCPVNLFNHHGSGLFDVVGNVWQHTVSPMAPYPGFKVHPAYDDFTVPTYDNMHNLIKGGAWASTGNEAQTLARYAFRRHFYQHAGFRYIEAAPNSAPVIPEGRIAKEDDPDVTNLVYDHYRDLDLDIINNNSNSNANGNNNNNDSNASSSVDNAAGSMTTDILTTLGVPQYPVELAKAVLNTVRQVQASQSTALPAPRTGRVLELGCAAGRGTFELARAFDLATGVDFTTRIIKVGKELKDSGVLSYDLPEAGSLASFHKIDLTAPAAAPSGLWALREKIDFVQADACNLDGTKFADYDAVVVASGFNALYSPDKLLTTVHSRLRLGGLLFIASDNSWDAATTPVANWLGGYKDSQSGERVEVIDAIAAALGPRFAPVDAAVPAAGLLQARRKRAGQVVITKVEVTAWRKVAE